MYSDEVNAKMAEQDYYNRPTCPAQPHPIDQCGEAVMGQQQVTNSRLGDYSLRDEAQKKASYHREQAEKAQTAAIFLHQNPAFEEFVRLVRSGAIQF